MVEGAWGEGGSVTASGGVLGWGTGSGGSLGKGGSRGGLGGAGGGGGGVGSGGRTLAMTGGTMASYSSLSAWMSRMQLLAKSRLFPPPMSRGYCHLGLLKMNAYV